jgi:RNA polymerase sigma factor (sigma-70 family)
MNDPHGDAGAATFTARQDGGGCDDVQLLRRIGQGDEDAMAAFYREHGRVVVAQVLLVTGERVLAEEIVQDTMLAVWRGAASFRGESSARSWVTGIARRQTRDRLRGRRLRLVNDSFLADQPGPGPGPGAGPRGTDGGDGLDPGARSPAPRGTGPGLRLRAQPPRGRRRAGDPGRDREEPPHRGTHRAQPDA